MMQMPLSARACRRPSSLVSRYKLARRFISPSPQLARLFACLFAVALVTEALPTFKDVTTESGIVDFERIDRLDGAPDFLERGGSIVTMDWDENGWQDLYITRYGQDDILFLNSAGSFTRVDNPLGLNTSNGGNASIWVDVDNDGRKDMIVAVVGELQHRLYYNRGEGLFEEQALARGMALPSSKLHQGSSLAAGDVNRDGYLDIIIGEWGTSVDDSDRFQHYALLLNRGESNPGHFVNISESSGFIFPDDNLYFYTPTISDLDGDGWPDIYVVADFGDSALFWNNGDGTFQNATAQAGVGVERHGMGAAIGDVDGDGLLDLFVTNIGMAFSAAGSEENQLYLNQGGRVFQNNGATAGVHQGGWGWGADLFDYDNDGDLDIVMVNSENLIQGPEHPYSVSDAPMILWRNDGTGVYTDASDAEGVNRRGKGSGIVTFDYDNDGDLDIFAIHEDSPPALLRNDASAGKWLRLSFEGAVSNRDGIGVFVTVEHVEGGKKQVREFNPTNAYLAQLDPHLHFGFKGATDRIHKITVRWPSSVVQEFTNVDVNQTLHIIEDASLYDESNPPFISWGLETEPVAPVIIGQPTGRALGRGDRLVLSVELADASDAVYLWEKDGEPIYGEYGPSLELKRAQPYDAGNYRVRAMNSSGQTLSEEVAVSYSVDVEQHSIARWWNEFLLEAIRSDFPAPTIHARNLYHVSAAMWDTYWAYEPDGWSRASPAFYKEVLDESLPVADREAARRKAISYASYRVLKARYANSVSAERTLYNINWLMEQLGYDATFESAEGNDPAAVGNRIGDRILALTVDDGSNEMGGYADTSGYTALNDPLVVKLPGVEMNDPNRWQPLAFDYQVTQNGLVIGESVQEFVGVNWREVETFAIEKDTGTTIAWDPGPPPLLGGEVDDEFIAAVLEVIRYSSLLDPAGGEMIDISPGALLNNPLATNEGRGRAINPFTDAPYEPNLVNHADYGRVLAEFWADGPASETPPGHWNSLFNQLSEHDSFKRRYLGQGAELSQLEWEVQAYLALNGAMHDAAVAAWTLKRQYDYSRPISMIRYLGKLGQSTDPSGPSYHAQGLPLVEGLVEVVTEESAAPGQRHEHLASRLGAIAVRTWAGHAKNHGGEAGGVRWILAEEWMPYQRDTFVTPAFAAYVSGHSAFSRAGAEVLSLLSGSPFFPGGLGSYSFAANEYLEFEEGPTQDLTLQWATFYDAADQAGLSRLYGGIHVRADDFVGRRLGARVGVEAFLKADALRRGGADPAPSMSRIQARIDRLIAGSPALVGLKYRDGEGRPIRQAPSVEAALSSAEQELLIVFNQDGADTDHTVTELVIPANELISMDVAGDLAEGGSLDCRLTILGDAARLLALRGWAGDWVAGSDEQRSLEAALELAVYREDGQDEQLIATNSGVSDGDQASLVEALGLRDGLSGGQATEIDAGLVLALEPGHYRIVLRAPTYEGSATLQLTETRY